MRKDDLIADVKDLLIKAYNDGARDALEIAANAIEKASAVLPLAEVPATLRLMALNYTPTEEGSIQ